MASLFRRLRRLLWFTTASLLILAALLLTLARVLLPTLLGAYHPQMEAYASRLLGQPLHVERLAMKMHRLQPQIVLGGVELLDAEEQRPVAQFASVAVDVDTLASLFSGRFKVAALQISGAVLGVVRHADGQVHMHGLLEREGGATEAGGELGNWLLMQQQLSLRDSRLFWEDEITAQRLDFSKINITLRNEAAHHQLSASLTFDDDDSDSRLQLQMDWSGDVLAAKGWSGTLYMQTDGLHAARWLATWSDAKAQMVRQGAVDLRLWSTWQDGRLAEMHAELAANNLVLEREVQRLEFDSIGMQAHWQGQGDAWSLQLNDIRLLPAGGLTVPAARMRLAYDGGWDVQALDFRLQDLAEGLALSAILDADALAALQALQVQGLAKELRIMLDAQGQLLHLQGGVEQMALRPWRQIPGFDGLQLGGAWDGERGRITLRGRDMELLWPQLFRQSLPVQTLDGELALQRDDRGWCIALQALQLANEDLELQLDGRLELLQQEGPILDLRGHFSRARALAVPRYLPAHIMPADAVTWLDQAFSAGRVPQGDLLFHGPLAAFPFDHHEGRFEVLFDAEQVGLLPAPGWPTLREVGGQVHFVNRGLTVRATGAHIYDSQIAAAEVTIADLHDPVLIAVGEAQIADDDGLRLLRETPLREKLGEYIDGLVLEGRSALRLNFELPLHAKNETTAPLHLHGQLQLDDNRLHIAGQDLIEALSGRLEFTERELNAKTLHARILQGESQLSIRTEGQGEQAQTIILGRGELVPAALCEWTGLGILEPVRGLSAWQGLLRVPHAPGAGSRLELVSDLRGLEIDLPPPFIESAGLASGFTLGYTVSGARRGQLELRYADRFSAQVQLSDEGIVRRGALHFGVGKAALPELDEWLISGHLRGVDLPAWRRLNWGAETGREPLPLRVQMDGLQLLPITRLADQTQAAEGGRLPDMHVQIRDFAYADLPPGELSFILRSGAAEAELVELSLQGELMGLTGRARWQKYPRSYSEAQLHLNSPDLGRLLKESHIASSISHGQAQMDFNIGWPGSLSAWELGTIEGRADLKVKKGRLDEVEPGAGRLLGLFSISALPRRLLLDFRDLFQQGLTFRSIQGSVDIQNGNAYSLGLVMDSESAELQIKGRTGFVARDYDQHITVIPNIADSTSLLGAFALGPQVGAITLLAQRLLRKNINQMALTEYHVTGSWEQPEIKKIKAQVPTPEGSSNDEGSAILLPW